MPAIRVNITKLQSKEIVKATHFGDLINYGKLNYASLVNDFR